MRKVLVLITLLLVPFSITAQVTSQGVPTYQEDTPHVSGQKGIMPLCKRTDTPASSAGTNNDWATFNCAPDGGQYVSLSGMTPSSNASFAPLDVTAYGAIGAAYALAVDVPDGTKTVILDNQTNGDVMVSMDAGVTDTFHVKAGDVYSLTLAQSGNVTTAQIYIKDGTAVSTSGSFYIYSIK